MRFYTTKVVSFLLALVLLFGLLPLTRVEAAGDAMLDGAVKALLNGAELHPQRTGYPELDDLMRQILADCQEADTYTKVKTAYDWVVENVEYSWRPYSQDYAPAYDCFVVNHNLYYEAGLEEVVPAEIANRAYHALKVKEGVCYDYAAAFALLVRYIGIDAYVHTGTFLLENSSENPCHHGWTELLIDGAYYIFDTQRESRLTGDGKIKNYYFGIESKDAWRYPEPETEINAERDAGFLPVAQERRQTYSVVAKSTASGETTGTDYYMAGEKATVTAVPTGDRAFVGWYDEAGQLLSQSTAYTFTVTKAMMVIAVFDNEYFLDVSKGEWYYKDANEAGERWIINGTRPFVFGAAEPVTQAMAVTMLARAMGGKNKESAGGAADGENAPWYAKAVTGGLADGKTFDMTTSGTAAGDHVTRGQFVHMAIRMAATLGKLPEAVSGDEAEELQTAQTLGLLSGYEDGSLRLESSLTRAEAVSMTMRLVHWMENN